jgi:eukaryotic-like serine/threonine-protein kinase
VKDTQEPTTPPLEIAHVLFMDIVGYSTLPMEQQTRLLGQLQEIVRETAEFKRAQKCDQLLRLPTGDGMALVFFGDPEASVRCAIEIGSALREHPDIKMRMGIHTGPVHRVEDINAARNVSGGGINIAQRVMDCGDAGHILLSSAVSEVLRQVSPTWSGSLHDLGEAEVKHGVRVHLYSLYSDEVGNKELPQKLRAAQNAATTVVSRKKRKKVSFGVVAVGIVAGVAIGGFLYSHRAHALTDKDTIVLADFANKTGDTVFDDTLKEGLSVALSESPFLNLVSDQKVTATMKLMGRHSGDPLTPEVAREVCVRTSSKAMLAGSISSLGTQYVIGLKAVNCNSGDALAQAQVQAAAKEQVLEALGKAATRLREKLGESLSTVQKYDTSLEQATTPSLEALQAFSEGVKIVRQKGDTAALPLFQRAIELDPHFAAAYAALGVSYSDLNEDGMASENLKRAYELRERASERERYRISASYYTHATEEPEKAIQVYEQWARAYPRDSVPPHSLGFNYMVLGQWDKALAETVEAIRLNPTAATYVNLVGIHAALNQLEEAKATYEQALARKLEKPGLHGNRYLVAFLERDAAEMQRQVAWARGKPEAEDLLLSDHSDTEFYMGRLGKAGELSRQAADVAKRNDQKETAALWLLNAALREAEVGNVTEAREQAASALASASTRDAQIVAALAFARAGNSARARTMADDLNKRSPLNTLLNGYWLPTIRAAIELNGKQPEKAVELLEAASSYEFGEPSPIGGTLYPVYLRGEAYLNAGQGQQAAAEFQKLIDHRNTVQNFVLGALAHLQIARAFALSGDRARTYAAYQDFLTLWKDADPDIPILKQAKAEYAKLQ